MKFVECEIRRSSAHGSGLFARTFVPRGRLVLYWPVLEMHSITTEEELTKLLNTNPDIGDTVCRLFGDLFIFSWEGLLEDEMVNHSFEPNLLYVCGVCIALKDIVPNQELTLDYRFLNLATIPEKIGDVDVVGYPAHKAARLTVQALAELLESMPDWKG